MIFQIRRLKLYEAAADLGVWMVNVHASGGRKMMETCVERLKAGNYQTQLIAVTVLTSMGREDLKDIGLDIEPVEQVKRLAKLTKESGLDGVVCSAQEAKILRELIGQDFSLVTREYVLRVVMQMTKTYCNSETGNA